jgi:transposase
MRSIAQRIQSLNSEITDLNEQLTGLVAQAAPTTLALPGVGTETAAQLLLTAGANIDRLRNEASFAALCAASPIPASSGKTTRHRLNPAGDRDANKALYIITIVRMRYCPQTKAYVKRRQSEGLTKKEAIRAVKRYIARDLYHAIRTDLTPQPSPLDDL